MSEIHVVLMDPTDPVVHRGCWVHDLNMNFSALKIACKPVYVVDAGDWAETSPGSVATCLWCVARGPRWPRSRWAGK